MHFKVDNRPLAGTVDCLATAKELVDKREELVRHLQPRSVTHTFELNQLSTRNQSDPVTSALNGRVRVGGSMNREYSGSNQCGSETWRLRYP